MNIKKQHGFHHMFLPTESFNLFGNRAPFISSFGSQVLFFCELLRSTCTKSSWLVLDCLSSISTSIFGELEGCGAHAVDGHPIHCSL